MTGRSDRRAQVYGRIVLVRVGAVLLAQGVCEIVNIIMTPERYAATVCSSLYDLRQTNLPPGVSSQRSLRDLPLELFEQLPQRTGGRCDVCRDWGKRLSTGPGLASTTSRTGRGEALSGTLFFLAF